MSVLLFGPFVEVDKRLTFFMTSDPTPSIEKKNFSRKASCDEKKKREDTEQLLNDTKGTTGNRRISVTERIKLASLELQVG